MLTDLNLYLNNRNVGTRGDGAETRAQIIECAGQLIARHGFAKTTSKSICEKAGVNLAAINYYFGSRDGLYLAVMDEVLNYIVNLDDIRKIYASNASPRAKMEAFIDLYIACVFHSHKWHIMVWVGEIMNPSPLLETVLKNKALPKLNLGQKILAQYLNRSEDDPLLHSYMMATIAPFVVTVWAQHNIMQRIIKPEAPTDALTQSIKAYVFAGLEAFKKN